MSSPDGNPTAQIDCNEPIGTCTVQLVLDFGAIEQPPVDQASPKEPGPEPESAVQPPALEYIAVIHLTRTWVQYGIFGFAVLCIVIGAVEALFGR